jgi:hypothetical protein
MMLRNMEKVNPIIRIRKNRGFVLFSFFWLLTGFLTVFAQEPRVIAEVDPNPVGVEDQVTLSISVSGGSGSVERPQLPPMAGLKLISGPNTSSQFQWVNGQSSSTQVFSYIFFPEKEGTLKIPAISVRVGGKVYTTRELTLQVMKGSVTGGSRQRRTPLSPFDDLDDSFAPFSRRSASQGEVTVMADLDKKNAFLGEQVTLTYRLLTQLPVAQVEMRESPNLKGFWVEEFELPKNPQARNRTINGKQFVEYIIKKQALFPTEKGILQIPSAIFALLVRSDSGGFFSLGSQESVLRKTTPLSLSVAPLTEKGRPTNFSGAVGEFKLEASLDKKEVTAGDAVNLKVTLSGAGNLKTISSFPLPEIPGFKMFSSKSNENIHGEGERIQGSKTWEYVIVPQAPGSEAIPELQFSYFSPATLQYQLLRTNPIPITILKGNSSASADNLVPSVFQQGVVKRGSDIHFIQMEPSRLKNRARLLYQQWWIYPVAFLPWIISLVLLGRLFSQEVRQRDEKGFRGRQARRMAERQLSEARKVLKAGEPDRFHAILEECLTRYLVERFHLPQIEVTSTRVRQFFEDRGQVDLGNRMVGLLEECSFARYAPSHADSVGLDLLLEKARQIIVEAEKLVERQK